MNPSGATLDAGLVTIVLPAKNEEKAIGHTLRALPLATLRAMGFRTEVVVLDGASQDGTAAIARQWGAHVVPDQEPGKGSALRNALPHLRGDYAIMLDADGTYAPDAIPHVLRMLAWEDAEVVMGTRNPQPGAMTGTHRVGNALISAFASLLYGRVCPDVCTGLWGFRMTVLRSMPLQSQGFGLEAELFAMASRRQLRLRNVPVDYLPRHGQTKLTSGPDGIRIVRRLVRSRFVDLPDQAAEPVPASSSAPSPTEAQA